MNSLAIVESPAGQKRLYYMVTLLSNVLRKNSAVDHQTLGTRIHRLPRVGKQRVPGTNSYATSRELMRFCLKMEQGKLVDAFSSREIKRLLYVTERRIRYASSPALRHAAVYFKSGSLYKCKPEPDFKCRKYHGNVRNFMNSLAIVESPAGQKRLYYMVTLLSNVLRKNSAVDHQTLGTRIHRLLEADHPAPPPQRGPDGKVIVFGDNLIGFAEKRQAMQLVW